MAAEMILSGRRAVVTGASSGIGRAVAMAFAREGAAVIVNYNMNAHGADACVRQITDASGVAQAVAANVAKPTDVERLVKQAKGFLGGIDIWANIAGADILTGASVKLSQAQKLDSLLDIDLRGTMYCCWAIADEITDGGSIVNVSWDLALHGMAGLNPELFAAVKAGVTGFTRSFARRMAPSVRVNDIAPGWIATAFAEQDMSEQYRDQIIGDTPLGRFGTPEDVAAAAVYLASDAAAFVTGQTLKVNGGLSS